MTEKLVIIGSGPAGLTAAIYAARANLSPLVLEGLQPGGQLTITSDIENFPGFVDPIGGPELMAAMRSQAERVGARFRSDTVQSVDFTGSAHQLRFEHETLTAQTVIIATGATARWLGIPSETALRGRGVSACATCDGFFFRGKEVAVVGGGDTALEEALYLTNFCSKVTLIHRRDEFRGSKVLQQRVLSHPKIAVVWNAVVAEIRDVVKGEVTAVMLRDVQTEKIQELPCAGLFVAIGHVPSTSAFQGQLTLDEQGYIVTEKGSTKTSVPGVFAAGDCQDHTYRQAITAAGTGCMAAIDAERYLQAQV